MTTEQLIQAIAEELADFIEGEPFDNLDDGKKTLYFGAATRIAGYLDAQRLLAG